MGSGVLAVITHFSFRVHVKSVWAFLQAFNEAFQDHWAAGMSLSQEELATHAAVGGLVERYACHLCPTNSSEWDPGADSPGKMAYANGDEGQNE